MKSDLYKFAVSFIYMLKRSHNIHKKYPKNTN